MKPPLPIPCLCLVTDLRLCQLDLGELESKVAGAVRGGVNVVQLREKDLPGGPLLEVAERLRRLTEGSALLFINERVDVAVACGADGVQLGEQGMPVGAARRVAGENVLIGRSVHSVEGAVEAERAGADLLLLGSTFATDSHAGVKPSGPHLLSRIADRLSIPLLGIGGIGAANVGQVIDGGGSGAAVISAILGSGNPEGAAREMKGAIDAAWERHYTSQPESPARSGRG